MLPRALLIDAGWALALYAGVLAAVTLALVHAGGLGWHGVGLALVAYALLGVGVTAGLALHAPHRRFGPANLVTLGRATYGALLVGLLGEGGALGASGRWALVAAGGVALALDGIDGWLARRSGLQSAFGARFDMESDALFVLALSALLYRAGQVGAWVLAIGLMRYLFVLAGWLWPPLAAPLPPSQRRRLVCVILIIAMLTALAPTMDAAAASGLCLVGLVLLVFSFGADCLRLAAAARRQDAPVAS